MADRSYLEKLLFLYLEFKEAQFGNYANLHDLLRQTKSFYEATREKKLDGKFEGIYKNLTLHFKDYMGMETNYYMESIEKNIAYLAKVISLDETEFLTMLKRGGIVDQSQKLVSALSWRLTPASRINIASQARRPWEIIPTCAPAVSCVRPVPLPFHQNPRRSLRAPRP